MKVFSLNYPFKLLQFFHNKSYKTSILLEKCKSFNYIIVDLTATFDVPNN